MIALLDPQGACRRHAIELVHRPGQIRLRVVANDRRDLLSLDRVPVAAGADLFAGFEGLAFRRQPAGALLGSEQVEQDVLVELVAENADGDGLAARHRGDRVFIRRLDVAHPHGKGARLCCVIQASCGVGEAPGQRCVGQCGDLLDVGVRRARRRKCIRLNAERADGGSLAALGREPKVDAILHGGLGAGGQGGRRPERERRRKHGLSDHRNPAQSLMRSTSIR
ncbi:MAG: hypothetical protein SGJ21_01585 [Alphaproteobacteria bacterium]|nr:hypothetical protein [Alphaproteobacteria bacterium]